MSFKEFIIICIGAIIIMAPFIIEDIRLKRHNNQRRKAAKKFQDELNEL